MSILVFLVCAVHVFSVTPPWFQNMSSVGSPKTFLFDIGRVLLDFDFESSLAQLVSNDIENPHDCICQVLAGKDALEKGLVDSAQYARWALDILQGDATIEQFYRAWRKIFTYNQSMWDCVGRIAGCDHALILISNINAIHCPWIFEAYPGFALFKQRILSFEIGMLKPDPAIYRYAIDTFNLNPENTVYIDDQPQNIATGKSMGFQCWQYDIRHHAPFEDWLQTILIDTDR